MARKVFISYSSTNAEQIQVLASDLESLGHDVWFDHELSGGQRWWDHILREIRDCDAFVFAVSAAAADSRACLSELEYAEALAKPVVPVTVERDFSESLLPPSLSELQRVNYTAPDKVAFAALNRALATLPAPAPLPDPLPAPPPVPASYLFDLKSAIDEPGQMPAERQEELVGELRGRLLAGHTASDVLALTQRFRQRSDLLLRIDRQLADLEAELSSQPVVPAGTFQAAAPVPMPPPQAPAQPPATHAALTSSSPPSAGAEPVAWWWWAVVIFFGFIGGAVAFFANRDANPDGAKNLLIGGIVASVVWFFLYYA